MIYREWVKQNGYGIFKTIEQELNDLGLNSIDLELLFNVTKGGQEISQTLEILSPDDVGKTILIHFKDKWKQIIDLKLNEVNLKVSNTQTNNKEYLETRDLNNVITDTSNVSAYNSTDLIPDEQTIKDNLDTGTVNINTNTTTTNENLSNIASNIDTIQRSNIYAIIISDVSKITLSLLKK